MRTALIIIAIVGVHACRGRIFKYDNYRPAASAAVDTFELTPERYDLYVKLICTKTDSISKNVPCYCDDKSDTIVEEEFMFIEKQPDPGLRRILVINKIPNQHQKFYVESAPQSNIKGLRKQDDTAFVNIWYFNQFRYGTFYDENSASFITTDRKSEIELWKIRRNSQEAEVTQLLGKYNKGYSFVDTDSALSLKPVFVRKPLFKVILQSYEKDAPRYDLANNRLFVEDVARKKKVTFFYFDMPVSGNYSGLYFKSNTVYAYPNRQNNISPTPAVYPAVRNYKKQ